MPPKGYQPLDPISVDLVWSDVPSADPNERQRQLLCALPSEAVRLAIGQADSSGNITFGPFTAHAKTGSYVVVLDYIKYESKSLQVIVSETLPADLQLMTDKLYATDDADAGIDKSSLQDQVAAARAKYFRDLPYWARPFSIRPVTGGLPKLYMDEELFDVPIYVGIGVRMVASVTVSDTTVNLGSLYGLATSAQENKLQGTLIIQTLGLGGERISPHIPLPSEINVTTIQNVIQALATIKSKLYDPNASVVPVVLALDDFVGRPGAKEQLVSALRADHGEVRRLLIGRGCDGVTPPANAGAKPGDTSVRPEKSGP